MKEIRLDRELVVRVDDRAALLAAKRDRQSFSDRFARGTVVSFARTRPIDESDIHRRGPAAIALLGGEIDMMFEQTYAALPSIHGGKVRPLAVTSDKRLPSLPEVPTMAELGYPDATVSNWLGLIAPKGKSEFMHVELCTDLRRGPHHVENFQKVCNAVDDWLVMHT